MQTLTIGFDIDETLLSSSIQQSYTQASDENKAATLRQSLMSVHKAGILHTIQTYCQKHLIEKIILISVSARQSQNIETYKVSNGSPTSLMILSAMSEALSHIAHIPCELNPVMLSDLYNTENTGTHMQLLHSNALKHITDSEPDKKLHKNPQAMCLLKCQLAMLTQSYSPNKEHILLFDDLSYITDVWASRYITYTVMPDMSVTQALFNPNAQYTCTWPTSVTAISDNVLQNIASCHINIGKHNA